jgi:hypothetical protein
VQRADCFAARMLLMHLTAFTTELESGSAESLRVVIMMVVQLLFSRVNTVPRYIIILLSRLTTLPRTPTFLHSHATGVVHAARASSLSLQRLELLSKVSQCRCGQLSLVDEMLGKKLDKRNLLVRREASDSGFEDRSGRCFVHSDEALVVHESEEAHDELTVHAVSHAAVTRDRVTEVLDVESALEARCEEATERRDERCESRHDKNVELHRRDTDGSRKVGPVRRDERQLVNVWDEDRVGVTFQASEDVGSQVVDRADEVLGAHENVGHGESKQDGEDPCTDEACGS